MGKSAKQKIISYKKELYGITFLAFGIFLLLCLISYNASDPSLTAFSKDVKIHNLGGVVGSYVADILMVLFGYASYFVPLSLLWVSFSHFAQREVRFGTLRSAGFLICIVLASIFIHLKFGELTIGGKASAAGGVVGWSAGGQLHKYLGKIGSYLFVVSGVILSFLWAAKVSARSVLNILFKVLVFVSEVLLSLATIGWARASKWMRVAGKNVWAGASFASKNGWVGLKKGYVWVREWVDRKRKGPVKIARPETQGGAVEKTAVAQEAVAPPSDGPRILKRIDTKHLHTMKRDQMEFLSTTTAEYAYPSLSLLDSPDQKMAKVDEEALKLNSRLLENKLADYGVKGVVTEIHPGPIVTMYEFQPAPGVKIGKIVNLEDDLGLIMGGKSVRIVSHLAGKAAVGIEIPNNDRETVWLKEIVDYPKFQRAESKLTLALGKDIKGIPQVADLKKMPHLLIAGATGSGKSVAINTMIISILYKALPEDVRFLMIDLKMLELSAYDGIPHLLLPVITSPKKSALGLRWCVEEMERRYEKMAEKGVRDLKGYNSAVAPEEKIPFIVIVIDELADLMMTTAGDVERYITRLAQMARAAGIHLILATQRPSVDVITGLIKANFPARISFKVTSKHDARTIIDTVGAEHLLGLGDMLFLSPGTSKLTRIHGAYVSEGEVGRITEFIKKQGTPKYDESIVAEREGDAESMGGVGDDFNDELYDQAVALVAETKQASISMIQRKMRIGYNRAARMIERMEKEGVVSPPDGVKPRTVLVQSYNEP